MRSAVCESPVTPMCLSQARADESAMQAVMKCAKDADIKLEVLMKSCDNDMSAVPGYKCFTKCVQQLMGIIYKKSCLALMAKMMS
ncbi:hypothetical protein FOCC_FOCC016443 [Frankliniella occidentalis]|nr:hypothetical protein FOCC_FOCC016443 [Frankliniella occidentalis]